jgi:23S rRNA (guanosine2251-2'-O)-methyltransferase
LSKQRRHTPARTVIYGTHAVIETLRAGIRSVDEVRVVREPTRVPGLMELVECRGVRVVDVSAEDLRTFAGTEHHQGLAAVVGPYPYADLEELLSLRADEPLPLLVLDEVQDPGNLGNILRGAECLGVSGVILTKDRSVWVTPAVEKMAAGASAHVPVARVVNLVRAIDSLKEKGYWIFGTAPTAKTTLYAMDLTGKAAFILGSEGKGMRRLVTEACDHLVSIPMKGKVASLNVSQSAVVLLAEALRQRLAGTR